MFGVFYTIFDRHIALEFVKQTAIVIAVLTLMVFIVQFTDLATKTTTGRTDVPSAIVVTLLRLPFTITELTFLSAFIGAMMAMGRLTTSAEATALNALGYSNWRLIAIGGLTSAIMAFLMGPLLSPLSGLAVRHSNLIESQSFEQITQISIFSIKPNVKWLSIETTIDNKPVRISLQPSTVDAHAGTMSSVRFDMFDLSVTPSTESIKRQKYFRWMHAKHVIVTPEKSILQDVFLVEPNEKPRFLKQVELPVSPDLATLKNGFPAPFELGFFDLWNSRKKLQDIGILSTIHVLRFQQLLTLPFLAFGSVMLASIFAMRPIKYGRRGIWVTCGYILGANLFFVYNLIVALSSGSIQQAQFTIWLFPLTLILISIWLTSFLEE